MLFWVQNIIDIHATFVVDVLWAISRYIEECHNEETYISVSAPALMKSHKAYQGAPVLDQVASLRESLKYMAKKGRIAVQMFRFFIYLASEILNYTEV